MSLSLPRSHIHIFMYIYHMYIWVNLLGTEVIISHTRELTLYSFILLVWNMLGTVPFGCMLQTNIQLTIIICPISAGSGTHNEIEVSVLLQERQKRSFSQRH